MVTKKISIIPTCEVGDLVDGPMFLEESEHHLGCDWCGGSMDVYIFMFI